MNKAVGICDDLIAQYQGEVAKYKIKIAMGENTKYCAEEIVQFYQMISAVREVREALTSEEK